MADLDLWLNANNNTTVFHKADNYDQHQHNGVNSLPFDRDKPHHAMRRKVWEKAFTGAQLKHYETPITNCVKEFLDVAAAAAAKGKSIDVSTYSLMMVCDIMGQVGFSKNFNAIKTAKSDMIRLLTALFGPVGKVGRMQWPLYVLKGFNIKPPAVTEWEAWFTTELKERLDRGEKQECNDIMTPLIEAYHESPRTEKDYAVLENDTGAVIVAAT